MCLLPHWFALPCHGGAATPHRVPRLGVPVLGTKQGALPFYSSSTGARRIGTTAASLAFPKLIPRVRKVWRAREREQLQVKFLYLSFPLERFLVVDISQKFPPLEMFKALGLTLSAL